MKDVKITVIRQTVYHDLIEQYENPMEHPCSMKCGQIFVARGFEKPDDLCDSA